MIYLATESPDRYVPVRSISSALNISFHFLTKIFQRLTSNGLVLSYRGPNGGIRLSRPAAQITLKEVVVAIEGPELFTECVLGLPGCGAHRPCPLHDTWTVARDELSHMLEGETLDQIGSSTVREGFRLSYRQEN